MCLHTCSPLNCSVCARGVANLVEAALLCFGVWRCVARLVKWKEAADGGRPRTATSSSCDTTAEMAARRVGPVVAARAELQRPSYGPSYGVAYGGQGVAGHVDLLFRGGASGSPLPAPLPTRSTRYDDPVSTTMARTLLSSAGPPAEIALVGIIGIWVCRAVKATTRRAWNTLTRERHELWDDGWSDYEPSDGTTWSDSASASASALSVAAGALLISRTR